MRYASARLISLAVVLLAIGCTRRQPLRPPDVQVGVTNCSQCGMTIDDERYVAAAVVETATGERESKVFDDIGCMAAYTRDQHDGRVLARYVKDFNTRRWLTAEAAFYVRGKGIDSPMGYGLLAANSRDAAATLAASKGGQVIDPAALQTVRVPHDVR